jgi:hypothetical protein
VRRPPAAPHLSQSYFFFFFAAFFFFAGTVVTSLPHVFVWRSLEEAPLAPGQTACLTRAGEPLLELFSRDPPDAPDPHRGDPRGIGIIHGAKAPEDGRLVNA